MANYGRLIQFQHTIIYYPSHKSILYFSTTLTFVNILHLRQNKIEKFKTNYMQLVEKYVLFLMHHGEKKMVTIAVGYRYFIFKM